MKLTSMMLVAVTNTSSDKITMNKFENALKKVRLEAIELLLKIKKGLDEETDQTKEMILTYLSFSQGEASEEEMKKANQQFRNFLKTIGFGALAILPFAPLTIPTVVSIGKRLGIDIIPKSFRHLYEKEHPKKPEQDQNGSETDKKN